MDSNFLLGDLGQLHQKRTPAEVVSDLEAKYTAMVLRHQPIKAGETGDQWVERFNKAGYAVDIYQGKGTNYTTIHYRLYQHGLQVDGFNYRLKIKGIKRS